MASELICTFMLYKRAPSLTLGVAEPKMALGNDCLWKDRCFQSPLHYIILDTIVTPAYYTDNGVTAESRSYQPSVLSWIQKYKHKEGYIKCAACWL